MASEDLRRTLVRELLPLAYLLTPNSNEARLLTGAHSLDDCARSLLDSGARQVLITGAHEESPEVINALYGPEGLINSWEWIACQANIMVPVALWPQPQPLYWHKDWGFWMQ